MSEIYRACPPWDECRWFTLAETFDVDLIRPEYERHRDADLSSFVDSPIEFQLLLALKDIYVRLNQDLIICSGEAISKVLQERTRSQHVICCQFQWCGYRSDFCIIPAWGNSGILIECDGHDFHERTKEQAAHDRKKDRVAQTNFFPILRFTGSEIHKDQERCAQEIIQFIKTMRNGN